MPKIKFQGDIPLSKGVIRVDPSLCGGCRICMFACSLANEGEAALDLARIQVSASDAEDFDAVAQPCLQCVDPQCLRYCPTGALKADEVTQARVIDPDLCIGCRLCIKNCPYELPRIRYDAVRKKAVKCNLCNGDPQCVKLCPTGALTYCADPAGVQSGYGSEGGK